MSGDHREGGRLSDLFERIRTWMTVHAVLVIALVGVSLGLIVVWVSVRCLSC